jgi:hypothetical protein
LEAGSFCGFHDCNIPFSVCFSLILIWEDGDIHRKPIDLSCLPSSCGGGDNFIKIKRLIPFEKSLIPK